MVSWVVRLHRSGAWRRPAVSPGKFRPVVSPKPNLRRYWKWTVGSRRRPILAAPMLELCQSTASKGMVPWLWVSVTTLSAYFHLPASQAIISPRCTLCSSRAMAAVKIFMVEPGS